MGKYFSINELCQSTTANKKHIDNTPSEEIKKNLNLLIDNILDPLREAYGAPIYISSGYRSYTLNKAVGGVKNSQHLLGQAADINVKSKSKNKKLFELIQKLNLPYDQLINEKNFAWVHVSYGPRQRRQILNL